MAIAKTCHHDIPNFELVKELSKMRRSPPKSKQDPARLKELQKKRIEKIRLENEQQKILVLRHRAEAQRRLDSKVPLIDKSFEDVNDDKMIAYILRQSTPSNRALIMKHAMPRWANKEDIVEIYQERDRLNEGKSGDTFQVDHYYPILGKTVCGLHVPDNLRIILKSDNCSKSNKHPELEAA